MLRRILLTLACSALAALALPVSAAPPVAHVIFLSDIHFDPFADRAIVAHLALAPVQRWRAIFSTANIRAFSGYGSDTTFPLLESALDAMRSQNPDPRDVAVTGDFLAHSFRRRFDLALPHRSQSQYDAFVDKTIAFVALEIEMAFPRARMLPVVGNNDGYCGDYKSTPGSPFLAHMAQAWAPSVGPLAPGAFVAQFSKGGYYTVPLPAQHLVAIVLNDIYWSPKYQNACGDPKSHPGDDELAWLAAQIKAIPSGSQAWLIGHIPPGVDVHATLHSTPPGTVTMLLGEAYNDALVGILQDPHSYIAFATFGHLHMSDFRIAAAPASLYTLPILDVPSISPIYANNPSFVTASISGNPARISDDAIVTLQGLSELAKVVHGEPRWSVEYRFDAAFHAQAFDGEALTHLHAAMFGDPNIRAQFDRYYDGGSGRTPITDAAWHAYWCGEVALTAVAYAACAMPQIQTGDLPPQPSPPPAPSSPPTPAPTPPPLRP